MNLRQKVKKAKKELQELTNEEFKRKNKSHLYITFEDNTMLGMLERFNRKSELQEIINKKRNYNRHFNADEEYDIDWSKLTYISFHADFDTLAVLKSSNGRPLARKDIQAFLEKATEKFKNYIKAVSEREPRIEFGIHAKVDYFFKVSNDRTKSKRLHIENLCYQLEGSSKVYFYDSKIKFESKKMKKGE